MKILQACQTFSESSAASLENTGILQSCQVLVSMNFSPSGSLGSGVLVFSYHPASLKKSLTFLSATFDSLASR